MRYINMDKQKKYTIRQNLVYCIKATKKAYPKLLVFCVCIVIVNCLIPVITAYLPKIVIEEIMGGTGTIRLLEITAGLTLTLAVLSGVQKYLSQLIYLNKFKMIQRLRKMSSLVK